MYPGLRVPGTVEGHKVHFLYDTGAGCTVVSDKVWAEIPEDQRPMLDPSDRTLVTVGGQIIPVQGCATLRLELYDQPLTWKVQVGRIADEAVLGEDVLRHLKAWWDWDTGLMGWPGCCYNHPDAEPVSSEMQRDLNSEENPHAIQDMEILKWYPPWLGEHLVRDQDHWIDGAEHQELAGQEEDAVCQVSTLPHSEQTSTQGDSTPPVPEHIAQLFHTGSEQLGEASKNELASLLNQYQEIFSCNDQDIGRTRLEVHCIPTGNAAPIRLPPRRAPMHLRGDIEEQIQAMLHQGIVEECSSPWAAPLVIVKKKDGSNRICVDYRALNQVTEKDGHPLPRIEDSLDAVAGATIYSTLDMTSGYHQVEVAEQDRDKTAFVDGRGHHLRYVTMPFGLCNAPATFQRLMEKVLQGLVWDFVVVYLDDVVVFSKTIDDHMTHLQAVFERFKTHNLKLKPRKCALFCTQVKYLGHIVSPSGVATDPELIEKVTNWEPPTTVRGVRAFLGLTGYYRTYIPAYGDIAEPLVRLTDARATFKWTPACQRAFEELQQKLVSAPILAYPNLEDTFVLDTDASDTSIGAVLSQRQGEHEKVIGYGSKALSKEERNYCVTRRELLAVVHFVEHYKYYLQGKKFVIRTDHASLRWMLRQKEPKDQLARWVQKLSAYDFELEYRPGQKHGNADGMSRREGKCFRGGVCYHPGNPETEIPPAEIGTHGVIPDVAGTLRQQVISAPMEKIQKRTQPEGPEKGTKMAPVGIVQGQLPGGTTHEMPPQANEPSDLARGLPIGFTPEQLREQQRTDPDLALIITRLEAGLGQPTKGQISAKGPTAKYWCARWRQLKMRGGILKYRWEAAYPGGWAGWKIITPHSWKTSVMASLHSLKAAGHMGIGKTWEKAKRCPYIWPHMRADLERFVRCCQLCQEKKSPAFRKRAKLVTYQVGAPFERIAADVAGPFPATESGNKYILVVQDYFSKWVEMFPMRNQTAETVATLLVDQVIARFGCPKEFHSDQGPNFESQLMQEVHKLLGVKKTRTTAYHPRGDGMVERYNRTMEGMLAMWTDEHQTDWDRHLALLGMAYRSAPQESTAETPNMINLGREITLPVDLVLDAPPEDGQVPSSQYALDLQERLRLVHEAARAHMSKQMVSQKRHYDQNVRLVTYHPGDLVWLHSLARKPGKSYKLTRSWKGPFLILEKINEVNFKIQASPRSKWQIVHADRLKPCEGRTASSLGFPGRGNPETNLTTPAIQLNAEQDSEEASSEDANEAEVAIPSDMPEDEGPVEAASQAANEAPEPSTTPRTRRGRAIRKPIKYADFVL